MAPSPDDPYPREAALDNQGLTIDIILKKAFVPSMRRMGWAEGPASFFMSDWVKADLATHLFPRV